MIPNIFSLLGESIVGKHIAKGIIFSNSPKKFHPNGSRIQVIAKSQTTTSSGGLEEPCKGDCVLPFKGGCYKPVTCPPIRNALLAYYWLPYKGHFLVISLFGLFLLLFNISLHCCFIDIAYCFHIIPSCPKFFISSSPEFGMPVKYL